MELEYKPSHKYEYIPYKGCICETCSFARKYPKKYRSRVLYHIREFNHAIENKIIPKVEILNHDDYGNAILYSAVKQQKIPFDLLEKGIPAFKFLYEVTKEPYPGAKFKTWNSFLTESTSECRRLIRGGTIYLNYINITDEMQIIDEKFIKGPFMLLMQKRSRDPYYKGKYLIVQPIGSTFYGYEDTGNYDIHYYNEVEEMWTIYKDGLLKGKVAEWLKASDCKSDLD